MKPVFVLAGQGIHCERESAAAYRAVGLDVEIVPLAHLFEARRSVRECALLHLPGGFSYGDQLGAGLVLANRLRHARLPEGSTLFEQIVRFVRDGGFVVGICNGFQVLVRTGLLPNLGGVNVLIRGLLGDGVAASTRFDPQAKGLGEWVRSRIVHIQEGLL